MSDLENIRQRCEVLLSDFHDEFQELEREGLRDMIREAGNRKFPDEQQLAWLNVMEERVS